VILDPVSGSLVHSLKYGGWAELAGFMAVRMAREIPGNLCEPLLAPVPTTPWRRRTRGYNQAALLAEALSSLTSIPLVNPLRRRQGRTQVRLDPRQRRANVRSAFHLEEDSRSRIQGREVILVDDILTTGATAISCALVLASGGVESVRLITFARSLPFSEKGAGRM